MNRFVRVSIPALACLCIAPLAVHAQAHGPTAAGVTAAECAHAAGMNHVQRRVTEKAAQGIAPLRQYVYRTRMIHQLDLMQTVAWLDQRRALQEACATRAAGVATVATQ